MARCVSQRYVGAIAPLPKDLLGFELKGRKLGRYDLLHRITRGGMSEVLLGQQRGHSGFRKLVVLKRVAADNAFSADAAQQMLIREARLTSGFVHSNIAQVFDLELFEGNHFLAMEFVPGVTLSELVQAARDKRERLPLGLCLAIGRDLAEALHYAHTFTEVSGRRRPVIHRDVAPKNVMIRWDGVTKLLDFGLAKAIDGPSQTLAGTVKGTVRYMSPEQIHGSPLDARTDVFSLGLVLYELVTGAPTMTPEDDQPPALRGALPSPSSRMAGTPSWLDGLLAKMLAPDREVRMASAREVSRELQRLGMNELWEQDAVANYLEFLFAQERAQMQQMLGKLAPDEGSGEVEAAPVLAHAPPLTPVPVSDSVPQLKPEPSTVTERPPGALYTLEDSGERTALRPSVGAAKTMQVGQLMDEPDPDSVATDSSRPALEVPLADPDTSGPTRSLQPLLSAEPPTDAMARGQPDKRLGLWWAIAATFVGAAIAWYLSLQRH